jgi:hypothetical protein
VKAFLLSLLLVPVGAVTGPDRPAPAQELLTKAQTQAKREKKAVFVVFDASW